MSVQNITQTSKQESKTMNDVTTYLEGPVVKPASGGVAKQLIIFLHGVGADGNDLISLSHELAPHLPDAQFSSPNAPFACDMAPFGFQWFSLQERTGEALLNGVRTVEPILNQYIDDQLMMLGLDDSKLAIVGFSQGTMTALHTMPRRAKPCAAVVGFSGALVGAQQLLDEMQSKPPVCLVHGDMDNVVPFEAMEIAADALEAGGFTYETHARPNLGHGIDGGAIEIAAKFLKAHLS